MATEKHNIDILVAVDNVNILNALKQVLPDQDDPRLWNVEYGLSVEVYDSIDCFPAFEGATILTLHICFEDVNDRGNILTSIRASQGLFNKCRKGSYIRTTTNNHQFPLEQRTLGDKIEKQYGRDSSEQGPDSMGIYTEDFIEGVSQGKVY